MLSNSLQALLVADGRQHSLSRDALLEQLLTGIIAGPGTLFSDIVLMTQDKRESFRPQALEFIGAGSRTEPESRCRMGFSQCVEHQLDSLRTYFRKISALSMELGTSLGVSGGYDSRLLLLLAREAGLPVSGYTYGSKAHGLEQAIARQLAQLTGIELRSIPVRMWTELDALELASNMEDALYRWDGRTNKGMGTFNDVHTTTVQRRAMGAAHLSLNGLGGELYRNYDHLRSGRLEFGTWFRYWVMGPESAAAVGNAKAMEAFVSRIARKYARLMRVNDLKLFDHHLARRWYRDVWLPFGAGPRLCADGQTTFALMPFADWTVSTESLRATPHLGTGGVFESAMIRAVSPEAARLNSNYGHSFAQLPLRVRLRDGVRSLVPLGPRLRLRTNAEVSFSRHRTSASDPNLPPSVQEGMLTLTSLDLPIDWGVFLSNSVNRDRCYYVAHFLNTFREHIRIDMRDTGEV